MTKAGNCWRLISYYFMQLLRKTNLKNTIRCVRIFKQCTGQSKISQLFSFLYRVLSKYLWSFWSNFLNWLTILNIFYVALNQGIGSPLTRNLILNFKLIVPNVFFSFQTILSGMQNELFIGSNLMNAARLRQNMDLSSKVIDNKYKSR